MHALSLLSEWRKTYKADSMDCQTVAVTSEHVCFYFVSFLGFFYFLFLVFYGRLSFWAHVKIDHHIVLYVRPKKAWSLREVARKDCRAWN